MAEQVESELTGSGETVEKSSKEDTVTVNDDETLKSFVGDSEIPENLVGDGPSVSTEEQHEEWMDILGSGALKKKIVQKGEGADTRPAPGSVVTIKYHGELDDGTKVDPTSTLTFTLGDGDVIQAFDFGVPLMEQGEVSEIYASARFAYGALGREPDIPGNSSILYKVELLKIENAVEVKDLDVTEKIQMGNKKRERGNYLFGRAEYSLAINSYKRALNILEEDSSKNSKATPSTLQELLDIRIKCYSNLAASQLKVEAYDAAIKSSDSVLNVQPNNVKALFRKGKALSLKGETEMAITILKRALELEPETKIIHQELSKLINKQKNEEASAKEMYRKMLGQDKAGKNQKRNEVGDQSWLGKWGFTVGACAAAAVSFGIVSYKYRLLPW